MRLEEQVCSLELARKLKELGVRQKSLFWWEQIKTAGKNEWTDWQVSFVNNSPHYRGGGTISAFTVAELGEMLPESPAHFSFKSRDASQNDSLFWVAKRSDGVQVHLEQVKTEADARAKMLIYIIENGLVEPEGKAASCQPKTKMQGRT